MNKKKVDETIEAIISLKKQKKDIQNKIDILVDSLKNVMDNNGVECLEGNKSYCYYKDIVKQVIDITS